MNQLNLETSKEFIQRLESLTESKSNLWGKMNSAEMLKHCRLALELPLGRTSMKPSWFVKTFFGKSIKKAMTDDSIYKPSLPTASEYITKAFTLQFQDEYTKLVDTINEFVVFSDEILNKTKHPLFGNMTSTEWRISQWKHLDHHWRQFGI